MYVWGSSLCKQRALSIHFKRIHGTTPLCAPQPAVPPQSPCKRTPPHHVIRINHAPLCPRDVDVEACARPRPDLMLEAGTVGIEVCGISVGHGQKYRNRGFKIQEDEGGGICPTTKAETHKKGGLGVKEMEGTFQSKAQQNKRALAFAVVVVIVVVFVLFQLVRGKVPYMGVTKNWPPKQHSSYREGGTLKAQPRQKAGRQAGRAQKRYENNTRGKSKTKEEVFECPKKGKDGGFIARAAKRTADFSEAKKPRHSLLSDIAPCRACPAVVSFSFSHTAENWRSPLDCGLVNAIMLFRPKNSNPTPPPVLFQGNCELNLIEACAYSPWHGIMAWY
eukprot:1157194-Pelagomonas_calceolata.AAC.7